MILDVRKPLRSALSQGGRKRQMVAVPLRYTPHLKRNGNPLTVDFFQIHLPAGTRSRPQIAVLVPRQCADYILPLAASTAL